MRTVAGHWNFSGLTAALLALDSLRITETGIRSHDSMAAACDAVSTGMLTRPDPRLASKAAAGPGQQPQAL